MIDAAAAVREVAVVIISLRVGRALAGVSAGSSSALMETSVVECGEQFQCVGLRLVMIDKQLRFVCCNYPPNPIHGGN